ncbi:MAG: Maf family protein [Roseinatronobacter sp.]
MPVILASSSAIRAQLLRSAGLCIDCVNPRVDEAAIRDALLAEGATPRDIADALAESKARKVAAKHPAAWVLGCDQVLAIGGACLEKPTTRDAARSQLLELKGKTHQLLSAAVLYHQNAPVWRHVGVARLTMRDFSEAYLKAYIDRNWPAIASSVGAYQLEGEGVRLFSQIQGDYFTVLGLPMLELLNFLTSRGVIEG